MNTLSVEKISDLLDRLYKSTFNSKPNGRFRIARHDLAALSGRQNIEQHTINQLKTALSEKHGLFLIDLYDEFAIIKTSIFRRYRKATRNVFEEVLNISFDSDETDDDD